MYLEPLPHGHGSFRPTLALSIMRGPRIRAPSDSPAMLLNPSSPRHAAATRASLKIAAGISLLSLHVIAIGLSPTCCT